MSRLPHRTVALILLLLVTLLSFATSTFAAQDRETDDSPLGVDDSREQTWDRDGGETQSAGVDVCAPFDEAHIILDKLQPGYYDHLNFPAGLPDGFEDSIGWKQEGKVASVLQVVSRAVAAVNPLNTVAKLTRSPGRRGRRLTKEIHSRAVRALELLQKAQDDGCHAALALRADIRLFPPHGFRQDLAEAFGLYQEFLQHSSDPHAQFIMGFFYATGLGGAPRDQAQATLYYTFAALQGYKPAQMAMAHRFWNGIGVKQDCRSALDYYENAAKTSYERFLSGPPGGETLPLTPWRLSDRFGGVFGPQASWAFTGVNANREAIVAQNKASLGESPHEQLEYMQFKAARGNTLALIHLGWFYYVGSTQPHYPQVSYGAEEIAEIPRNYAEAKAQFLAAARQIWPAEYDKDGKPVNARKDVSPSSDMFGRMATDLLARMLLRGEGGEPDPVLARLWLRRAGNRVEASNLLGIIHRDGISIKADRDKARSFFEHGAENDLGDAEANLGKMLLEDNEIGKAAKLFESAIRHGARFEPFYHLGKLHADQARSDAGDRSGACGVAVGYYKLVSETGSWDDNYLGDANRAWLRGEHGKALLGWWIAAEMGYETGQNNVAYVLDRGLKLFDQSPILNDSSLVQWTRSAAQGNADSMLVVGDRYYSGNEFTRALTYYQTAADKQSAMAYWNVGWMHENGLGVPRDWHLAKRNYDHALDVSSHAYLPWLLSMARLYVRSWLNEVRTGGAEPGLHMYEEEGREIDTPTVFEGLKRLFVGPEDMAADEGNQYEDHSGSGWEGAGGGGEGGDGDDEAEGIDFGDEGLNLMEDFIVLGLVLAISGLFWLRGRWAAEAMRQAQAAAVAR